VLLDFDRSQKELPPLIPTAGRSTGCIWKSFPLSELALPSLISKYIMRLLGNCFTFLVEILQIELLFEKSPPASVIRGFSGKVQMLDSLYVGGLTSKA